MSITGTILKAALDALLGKLEALFPWLRSWLDRPISILNVYTRRPRTQGIVMTKDREMAD